MTPTSVHESLLAELRRVQPICAAHGLNRDETLQLAAGSVLVRLQRTQPAEEFRAMDLIDQAVAAVRRSWNLYDSRSQHLLHEGAGHHAGFDESAERGSD